MEEKLTSFVIFILFSNFTLFYDMILQQSNGEELTGLCFLQLCGYNCLECFVFLYYNNNYFTEDQYLDLDTSERWHNFCGFYPGLSLRESSIIFSSISKLMNLNLPVTSILYAKEDSHPHYHHSHDAEPGDGEVGRGPDNASGLQNEVEVTLVQPRRLTIIIVFGKSWFKIMFPPYKPNPRLCILEV